MPQPDSPPPRYDPAPLPTPRSPPSPSHLPSPSPSPAPPQPHRPPHFSTPSRPRLRQKPSILDELIPLPTTSSPSPSSSSSHAKNGDPVFPVLRRLGSVAVVTIFLCSAVFLACTSAGNVVGKAGTGLREVFGVGGVADVAMMSGPGDAGGAGWVAQEIPDNEDEEEGTGSDVKGKEDFERYTMLRTIPESIANVSSMGRRLIFIGDVHGSLDPLERLMKKIDYDTDQDHLIHVGDLIAKGSKNDEVLTWMNQRRIPGVRGNHDQPVLQWRAWMEWAGGRDWEAYMDSLGAGGEEGAVKALKNKDKLFPSGWEWKGEHWKIARQLQKHNYLYLLQLPLVLHIPSLHTLVVHAGLLPRDLAKSASDPSQPLIQAADIVNSSSSSSESFDIDHARMNEEISLLFSVPQNQDPWTLINMRSVRKGNKPTKSGSKGTPWSEIWGEEMARCKGEGEWSLGQEGDEAEAEAESAGKVDAEVAQEDEVEGVTRKMVRRKKGKDKGKGKLPDIGCSPVTVIYGHAAGRGLDIKPWSKGIDTGCVYGRELTALVLGDLTGLKGKSVRVGDKVGVLVSEQCGKGGT